MSLQLSKVVPKHTHTQAFTWIKRGFSTFGSYAEARKRAGMKVQEKCFWCRRPFVDADSMALAGRTCKTNILLCDDCATKAGANATAASVTFKQPEALTRCAAGRDGDCNHPQCPQNLEGEPMKTGRHCPLDTDDEDDDL